MQQLNQAQLDAVLAPIGPTLVLAGAGSGKTRVLTNRIIHLVKDCGAMPRNILAITFTNKAAGEMRKRLLEWNDDAQFMTISTIHSFCAMVLRSEAQWLDRQQNFTIYVDDDKRSLLKKVIAEYDEDTDNNTISDLSGAIANIKNNAVPIEDIKQYYTETGDSAQYGKLIDDFGLENLVEIIGKYTSRLADNNAMDFDDLLYYTHKLFRKCPEVLAKYQNRYSHILIDEFQDTNKVQYEIFRMIADAHGSIFVVGDDDQSIYGWRGAEVANILNFNKEFDGVQIFKLEQNYRSTKKILDVSNHIISFNQERFDKKLWTDNSDGVRVEQFSAYNEQEESYYVVSQIKALMSQNGYKPQDFAILMRINALTRQFEQLLNREGIPYKVFGGFKFFDRKEIKDILSYLRLIDNSYDNEACVRCFNVPYRRGIGDTTITKLLQLSNQTHLPILHLIASADNLEGTFNKGTISKLVQFYSMYNDLVQLSRTANVSVVLRAVIDRALFRTYYTEIDDQDRLINIDELEQSVLEYTASSNGGSVADYLQTVSLDNDRGQLDDGQYVTLATVHAVKGLEFGTVFVVGLEDGIFPTGRAKNSFKDSQEERRLMYVACTRACKRLYLTSVSSRFIYGSRQNRMPSIYFSEIRKYLTPVRTVSSSSLDNDAVLDRLNRQDRSSSTKPTINAKIVNTNTAKFAVGQKVAHKNFGNGIIVNIRVDIAEIVFERFGKKTMSLKVAPLEIL